MAKIKTRIRAHYHFCDTITMEPFDGVARLGEFEMEVDPSDNNINYPIEFEARNRIAALQRESYGSMQDSYGHLPWIQIDMLSYQAASEPTDENWFYLSTMNLRQLITTYHQAYLTAMDGWSVMIEAEKQK